MVKKISVYLIGVIVLFLYPSVSKAQYHKLNARDFAGTPATDDGFAAYTYCYVSYSYNTTRYKGNYNIDFNVQLLLNTNKSWIKFDQMNGQAMLQSVLRHEQGHYNIAYLMKNELYSVFTHHQYTSNYQQEIAQLFHEVEVKYHKMNDDYEAQTQHMADVRNQEKWNMWFNNQLGRGELAQNSNIDNNLY